MIKKFRTREEAGAFFDNLNLPTLRRLFIDMVFELQSSYQPKRIAITEEQLATYFKVIGRKDDGTEEKRGRPKSKTE